MQWLKRLLNIPNPFRTRYRIVLKGKEYIPQRKTFGTNWQKLPYHFATSLESAQNAILVYYEEAEQFQVIKTYN